MKINKFLGVSMALATLITNVGYTVSTSYAGTASGDASTSGNADINTKKKSTELTREEKRQILLKLGFIDATIKALTEAEINEYCDNYLDGVEVLVDSTCYLLNEEEILKEKLSASKEDYLNEISNVKSKDYKEQKEMIEKEYSEKEEMLNDFLELNAEEITKKYGFSNEEVKNVQCIAKDVKKGKKKKNYKGKKAHGCSENSCVSTSLSIKNDKSFARDGKKISLTYSVKSAYGTTQTYKDISAIGWDGDLEVDGSTFRTKYNKLSYSGDMSRAEFDSMSNQICFDGSYVTSLNVCGIVQPTSSSLSSKNILNNMEKASLACWTGKQVTFRNYKNYTTTSVAYKLDSGVSTLYVHPSADLDFPECSCKIYGEYIHKTSSLQKYSSNSKDNIGKSKYTSEYFPTNSSTAVNVIKGGIGVCVGVLNTTVGVIYGITDITISNFCKTSNVEGPVCTTVTKMNYFK